ncbi:MAG: hypothetical protein ACP5VR_12290 [Acidimicrobiales bacterium]
MANLLVATQNNAARTALSADKAAKAFVHAGHVDDSLLNQVEMAVRAYEPCIACAPDYLPGHTPLVVEPHDEQGATVGEPQRA